MQAKTVSSNKVLILNESSFQAQTVPPVDSLSNKENKSALELHIDRFSENGSFSPSTVTEGLRKIHGFAPSIKGTIIAGFNSAHVNQCPFLSSQFKRNKNTGFAKYLHLGTTRIWNADGTINEARWQKFVSFVTEGQLPQVEQIVAKSTLKNYLNECLKNDPQETHTGRNSHSLFSSKSIQSFAASAAWDETFERLACGWVLQPATDEYEPYITLSLVRLFFENSKVAFLEAETKKLPVVKPNSGAPLNVRDISRKFNYLMDVLVDKQTQLTDRGYIEEAAVVALLYKNLKQASTDYLQTNLNQDNYSVFKKQCNSFITPAKKILEQHRGWSDFFIKLGLAIITLGVACLIPYTKGSFWEIKLTKTDSTQKLDKIADLIEVAHLG